jgi:hypothetical protein
MSYPKWRPVLVLPASLLGIGVLLPLASLPPALPTQETSGVRSVARVCVQDRDHLNAVAPELDIWETHPQDGYVIAALASEQKQWLEGLGYRLDVHAKRTEALQTEFAPDPRFYCFATVMKDQNGPNGDDEIAPRSPITTTGIFISLHSYGDLVLWPWSFDDYGSAPNLADLETIGRKFALYNGYGPAGTIWYEADGTTDDWTYGKLGIASYTFEVGPQNGECAGFFPPYECIDGYGGRDFWGENKQAFLYAHKIARTPFLSAYGPDAQNVMFSRTDAQGSGAGQLTATIADDRCCGDTPQPIRGAVYFVDAPGEDGTGLAMVPVDEGWGDVSEDAVAVMETSELPLGQHYILVHGQNEDGRWGPFGGAFVQIGQRVYLPSIIEG